LSLNMDDGYHSDISSICNSPGAWPGSNNKKMKKPKSKPKRSAKKLTKRTPVGGKASAVRLQASTPCPSNVPGPESSGAELHPQTELGGFSHRKQSSPIEHGFIGGVKLKLADVAIGQRGETWSADRQCFKISNHGIVVQPNHILPDDVQMQEVRSRTVQDQDVGSTIKEAENVQLPETDALAPGNLPHDQTSYAARIAKESSRFSCLTIGNLAAPPLPGREYTRFSGCTTTAGRSNYPPFELSQHRRATRHENIRTAVEVDLSSIRAKSTLSTGQWREASDRFKPSTQSQTVKTLLRSGMPQGPGDVIYINPIPDKSSGGDCKDDGVVDNINSGLNSYERQNSTSSFPMFENISKVPLPGKSDGVLSSASPSIIESPAREVMKPLLRSSRGGSAAFLKLPTHFWRRTRDKSDQISEQPPATSFWSGLKPVPTSTQISDARAAQSQEPFAKMFVVCCKCSIFHDLPSKIYEVMAGAGNGNQETGGGMFDQTTKTVPCPCPWCRHAMTVKCCAGYAAVVYIRERFH
jgi:hypothetical protein